MVFRVMPKEAGKPLLLQHQATVRCARSHPDQRAFLPFQDQIFRSLNNELNVFIHVGPISTVGHGFETGPKSGENSIKQGDNSVNRDPSGR
mmetsp:Transcript_16040/g.23810  ORF Transcript_16040/g.23810 Transcript_16040/m.23810 type:complete len:91 (+) Transcript_16040:1142-1414(+)